MLIADFWLGLSLIKPYSMWTGGFIYGFFFQKGLYNAVTIDQYIEDWFRDRPIKRHITIGVTNLLNGAFEVYSEHQKTSDMIELLKASVAFSGMSPAIPLFGSLYLSGNSIYENDVNSAIRHCEELGYDEKDIVIDSIITGSVYMDFWDASKQNALGAMQQSSKLWKYYDKVHGILRAKITH